MGGFVGYRSSKEANECMHYFNNTFVNSSKISVEMARKNGSMDLQRRCGKHLRNKRGVQDSFDVKEKSQDFTLSSNCSDEMVCDDKNDSVMDLIDGRDHDILESPAIMTKVVAENADLNYREDRKCRSRSSGDCNRPEYCHDSVKDGGMRVDTNFLKTL